MDKIGVVTGLKFEARLLEAAAQRANVSVPPLIANGFGEFAAQKAAEALLQNGATALLSFGLAGGLDPSLSRGTVLVPTHVVNTSGDTFSCDGPLHARLSALRTAGASPACAPIAYASHVLATVADKAALRATTQACATDMESGSVGKVAHRAGVPFAVLRVIADEAGDMLPPIALEATGPDGSVRLMRSIGLALRRPWQIPGLIHLGRNTAHASRTLDQLAQDLATGFFSGPGL